MLTSLGALLRSSGFVIALLTACGASLLAVVISRRVVRSIALGLALVIAALAGLAAEDVLKVPLAIGLVLIALGALAADGQPVVVRGLALAPGGALLVTIAADSTEGWARALVLVTIVCAGPAAVTLDRRFPNLTVAVLAVSALGAYATVPDTEQARALVGALLPVALLGLSYRSTPEPSTPSLGVALIGWVALVGGIARPGSVVGAIGCLGVLWLGPLARRNVAALIVAVHVPVVVVASRVSGLRQSAWAAAAVLLPVAIGAATVLVVGEHRVKRNSS